MKQDIYGHEQRYKNWKEIVVKNGIDELTKANSDILKRYIFDMEIGANTANKSKKGARSYHRLNCVRQKLFKVFQYLQNRKIKDVTKITEQQITTFFDDMRKGVIKTEKGEPYKATADYVKGFKAFWHWHQKTKRKEGILIQDITEEVDSSREEKPVWVYLNEKQMATLLKKCSPKYSPLLEFLYCSGSRVTEAFSLLRRDITEENGVIYANISKEIAKSIGRKIKLLLCGKNLLEYIKENNIGEDDLLFPFSAPMVNKYLNEFGKALFGEGVSQGGEKYSKLAMYDFRHNSCCYWISRYKTISALMYKFGWKSERYVHYYSEFLGMKDPIKDEDLYVDITKTELEREIEFLKKENELFKGDIEGIKELIQKISLQALDNTELMYKFSEKAKSVMNKI